MDSNQQQFRWALLVVDCMKQPRAEGFRFVDQEVMPKFDGSPKGTFAWFICEHYYAREKFDKFDLQAATEAPKSKLRNAEFPQGAVETLRTYVTSQTEIQAGVAVGDGFAPFRSNFRIVRHLLQTPRVEDSCSKLPNSLV